jgi:hypothetical protein
MMPPAVAVDGTLPLRLLYGLEARVRIAKAAIARRHVRDAFFHRTVLALPNFTAPAEAVDGAPGRLGGSRRPLIETQEGDRESRSAQKAYHVRLLGSGDTNTARSPQFNRARPILWRTGKICR